MMAYVPATASGRYDYVVLTRSAQARPSFLPISRPDIAIEAREQATDAGTDGTDHGGHGGGEPGGGRTDGGGQRGSSVQVALRQKHDLQKRIEEIQETRRLRRVALHQRIRFTKARLHNAPGAGEVGNHSRYRLFRKRQLERIDDLRAQERQLVRTTRARARASAPARDPDRELDRVASLPAVPRGGLRERVGQLRGDP